MGISSYKTEGGGYAFSIDLNDHSEFKEMKVEKDKLIIYLKQKYNISANGIVDPEQEGGTWILNNSIDTYSANSIGPEIDVPPISNNSISNYKEGFRDGYVACQQQMLFPKLSTPVVDWTKPCTCGGTGECKCKTTSFGNNTPTYLAG